MRVLILAALLLPVPVLAEGVAAPKSAPCAADSRVVPATAAGADGFRRLDRLPPAAHYLAVYRAVGGCPAPVVVRYGIGAPRH